MSVLCDVYCSHRSSQLPLTAAYVQKLQPLNSLTPPCTGASKGTRKENGGRRVCVFANKGTHTHTSASLPHVSHKAPEAATQTEQQLEQKRSQPKVFGD